MSGNLTVLTGPSPSGKSTWARKWVAKRPDRRVHLAGDPTVKSDIDAIRRELARGMSVAFETNVPVAAFPKGLLRHVALIKVFNSSKGKSS